MKFSFFTQFPTDAKAIAGYPDYAVDAAGQVFSLKWNRLKKLKPFISSHGYVKVCLTNNGVQKDFFVHRAVLLAFSPEHLETEQCNHKDGNKLNNSLSNLEWCSPSENMLHAFKLGLKVHTGEQNPKAILTAAQVHLICKKLLLGAPVSHLAAEYDVRYNVIYKILHRTTWKAIGSKYFTQAA